MPFKAKLRKVGNSVVVTIPSRYLEKHIPGEEIELEVVGAEEPKATPLPEPKKVYTGGNPWEFCSEHHGFKRQCGCK